MKNSICMAILSLLILSQVGPAADWPHWRGPAYDGVSRETLSSGQVLNDFTKPLWTASVGIGFSAVSVADGKALTMGNIDGKTDRVVCFDAASGRVLWEHTYPQDLGAKAHEGGTYATPTIADDKVYTLSKYGRAFCLDLNDGKVLWEKQFDYEAPEWGFAGSVLILDDLAIYDVGRAGAALNKETGEAVWQSGRDRSGYSTGVPATIGGTEQVVMFCKKNVLGFRPRTGEILWSLPWETKYDVNAADPIIAGDEVFIASGYNRGCSLIRVAGDKAQTVWENKNMRSQMSGPVLIDGYLYGFDDNALACVDWKTGEQKWSEKSTGKGSLSAAGDKLIVISEKGELIIAKATPEKYEKISSAKVLSGRCWTMPVLANGRIYVCNSRGDMVCVDVSGREGK